MHDKNWKSGKCYGDTSKHLEKYTNISLAVKIRLYESVVVSTLLYGAELWPLSVTQMKKLEAAHHKFQRRRCDSPSM